MGILLRQVINNSKVLQYPELRVSGVVKQEVFMSENYYYQIQH